ncbi:hypothetical protein V8F20_009411 [Naviculisporaceae sp. PSN 640]
MDAFHGLSPRPTRGYRPPPFPPNRGIETSRKYQEPPLSPSRHPDISGGGCRSPPIPPDRETRISGHRSPPLSPDRGTTTSGGYRSPPPPPSSRGTGTTTSRRYQEPPLPPPPPQARYSHQTHSSHHSTATTPSQASGSPFRDPPDANNSIASSEPILATHNTTQPLSESEPIVLAKHNTTQPLSQAELHQLRQNTKLADDSFSTPYPQWVIQLARSILAIIEVGFLVYGCFFLVKWQPTKGFDTSRYELAIVTVGVAMALDLGAVIFSTCQRYGKWGWWLLVILVDFSIGIMGVLGGLKVFGIETNGQSEFSGFGGEDRGVKWEAMGRFVGLHGLICGSLHIFVGLAGCAGSVIMMVRPPKGRRRRPSRGQR